MALIIENKIVKEDILDKNGNKLGEIKFDPNDSTIMSKLSKITKNLSEAIKKINEVGRINDIPNITLEKLEDFESVETNLNKVNEIYTTEYEVVESVINDLTEVFGKETMDIITGGSKNINTLSPLIDFIMPYIQEARGKKVNKYMPKSDDVEVLN